MNAPKPENEMILLRRQNTKLLNMLLEKLDFRQQHENALNDLQVRVTDLESLIEHAQSRATRRKVQTGETASANQIKQEE